MFHLHTSHPGCVKIKRWTREVGSSYSRASQYARKVFSSKSYFNIHLLWLQAWPSCLSCFISRQKTIEYINAFVTLFSVKCAWNSIKHILKAIFNLQTLPKQYLDNWKKHKRSINAAMKTRQWNHLSLNRSLSCFLASLERQHATTTYTTKNTFLPVKFLRLDIIAQSNSKPHLSNSTCFVDIRLPLYFKPHLFFSTTDHGNQQVRTLDDFEACECGRRSIEENSWCAARSTFHDCPPSGIPQLTQCAIKVQVQRHAWRSRTTTFISMITCSQAPHPKLTFIIRSPWTTPAFCAAPSEKEQQKVWKRARKGENMKLKWQRYDTLSVLIEKSSFLKHDIVHIPYKLE